MAADSNTVITEIFPEWDEYQLFLLTAFYRERLEKSIEEEVEGVSFMLTYKRQISRQDHQEVIKLREKGNRVDGSKLLLRLLMEKDPRDHRLIWKFFLKMQHILPKFDALLKEVQEHVSSTTEMFELLDCLPDLRVQLRDVDQKHKETLRAQTETLRVNTILMREKVKVFQLVDRYAELTVISTVRDRRLVEHELLARGKVHDEWRQKHLREELVKLRTDQLFHCTLSRIKSKTGSSAVVVGDPGIGKTTMVQKIVNDWATGKIYHQFQFVFSFNFRELNSINSKINMTELILNRYPYFRNVLTVVWKNPKGLLFIFDGLDEFKHRIDFADSQRDTELKHQSPDPECWCEVSDIVYSLIQGKLLPGCSVLVTTRPTALHLLKNAEISVWAEILGFVGEGRKEYFIRHFEDQTVAAAVFKHVEENEILYTMSYNPSYCWILALSLGPFFTQRDRDPQRIPKTLTQLYSRYIYNILKNHGREIENPRDVLLRVGQMAFRGVLEKKIVFTNGDLINDNLQSSQFLSGFLAEREDSSQSVVYTFPHLTIQEFVAAVAQFLTLHSGDILKFLTDAHNKEDGRFEVFLRFVAGLSSPMTARCLEEFLGPFPHQTTCRVIDWVKEEVKRQSGNTENEAGKRSLLNTLHYLFESQNSALAHSALGDWERVSFSRLRLTVADCNVLSRVIEVCDRIKCLDLWGCSIQHSGLLRLKYNLPYLQELRLGNNMLRDSGVQLVSDALRNPECKIKKLELGTNYLTASCAEDLSSALASNHSLTSLAMSGNKLEDSGVKQLLAVLKNHDCNIQALRLHSNGLTCYCAEDIAITLYSSPSLTEIDLGGNTFADSGVIELCRGFRNPKCKLQKLRLGNARLRDSCADDLASSLIALRSLKRLDLKTNSFTDISVPALRRLILTHSGLERINVEWNAFTKQGRDQLRLLQGTKPLLKIEV